MGGDDGEQPQRAEPGLVARNVPLAQELVLRLFPVPDVAVFVSPSGGIVFDGVRRRRRGRRPRPRQGAGEAVGGGEGAAEAGGAREGAVYPSSSRRPRPRIQAPRAFVLVPK